MTRDRVTSSVSGDRVADISEDVVPVVAVDVSSKISSPGNSCKPFTMLSMYSYTTPRKILRIPKKKKKNTKTQNVFLQLRRKSYNEHLPSCIT